MCRPRSDPSLFRFPRNFPPASPNAVHFAVTRGSAFRPASRLPTVILLPSPVPSALSNAFFAVHHHSRRRRREEAPSSPCPSSSSAEDVRLARRRRHLHLIRSHAVAPGPDDVDDALLDDSATDLRDQWKRVCRVSRAYS